MEQCDTELHPDSDPTKKIDQLKSLTGDVIAEGKKVEDLKKVQEFILFNFQVLR